jgi:lipopolysaccharide biosynthesis glycosyltransferase
MIRLFLGYDTPQCVSFHVAGHSVLRHASEPVSITPLMLSQLRQVFTRPRDPKQSTDFSFTRFLVPFLCGHEGWAIFADGDMVFRKDIAELWKLRDDRYAIQVVKHDHVPQRLEKFLGHAQIAYARKNWSSLILFNNARCRALTQDYVQSAAGLDLHQFKWLKDDDLIGALPREWNHLVDYDPTEPLENIANLHFTDGGPWLESHSQCGYASVWKDELDLMLRPMTNRPSSD